VIDARDPICACGLARSKHSPFHIKCGGYRPTHSATDHMRRESSHRIAGANSAATKRARGQELIPRLSLKGSTPHAKRAKEEA
jgi:hypothetical protein